MKVKASRNCEALAHRACKFLDAQGADVKSLMGDMTLHIGLASDPEFKTPAHARDCLYIGDSAHLGNLVADAATRELYKQNKKFVALYDKFNYETGKWDMVAKSIPHGVGDAAPDLLASQGIAPWSQGFFSDIFERPLLYSHASDLVKLEQGTLPWCEVMNLYMADYGGSAVLPQQAGTGENAMTKDVTVSSGMMSAMVINMYVTYSLTVEEQEGAKAAGGNPFGQKMIQKKIQYANYVLQMLTDYLTYYGNSATDTQGLFQVNTITAVPSGNDIHSIVTGAGTSKGSVLYQKLAAYLNDFFGKSYNKFDSVSVAMSTYAYNQLSSVPYSDVYSAESPLAVFEKNYNGGRNTKEGNTVPRVTFYADPMLDAGTTFNSSTQDYLVITAKDVGMGVGDERKNLILQGMPLKEFVYPVIPGMVNTQHRMLRRYAGIFAPLADSVKIYSGFGVQ